MIDTSTSFCSVANFFATHQLRLDTFPEGFQHLRLDLLAVSVSLSCSSNSELGHDYF